MREKQALTWYCCRQNMLCSRAFIMSVKWAHFYVSLLVGLTCLAGRRCYHSRSPHRDPSPVAWRASGSLLPDPEARRGECWQTPSRWLAAEAEDRESSAFHNRFPSSIGGKKKLFRKYWGNSIVYTLKSLEDKPINIGRNSPWALRNCSTSWCRSPEMRKQNVWLPGRCLNISSQCLACAFMHHWPAVSCCAPGRCPCSPDASCISQCWSQSDN